MALHAILLDIEQKDLPLVAITHKNSLSQLPTKIPSIRSWSWRKILQLRDRIRPFIRHKVCNGVGTFLWHNFWNQLGPLLPRFGDRIIYDYAIHRNAHVAEVIGGGRWNWPIANSADLIAIKNSFGDYPIDDSREDTISWSLTSSGVFTVTAAWN